MKKVVDSNLNHATLCYKQGYTLMNQDDVKIVRSRHAANPQFAAQDAVRKSAEALAARPDFFTKDHLALLNQVKQIVDKFIPIKEGLYVNHRLNRGKPFSVIKLDKPKWPLVSHKRKIAEYESPLATLGVEVRMAPKTNSTLFYIRSV
jgi:hypothetical protein